MPLGGTDNEALPGCVYDFLRHPRQRIDLHHAGDLCQQTMQQTEIAARDPDDGRQDVCIVEAVMRQGNSRRDPLMTEQVAHGIGAQGAKFVHKTDARIELRITRQPFLSTRHANQDHTKPPLVKDITHLFQARGLQAIGFIKHH